MCKLDLEDKNFLEDLIEELPKIDKGVYKPEAEELENILHRLTNGKNWQRIKFKCSKCGMESWMEFDLEIYVVKAEELICDDCNPVEEEE